VEELATSSESEARRVRAGCPDASLSLAHCSGWVGCSLFERVMGLAVAVLAAEVVEPSSSRLWLGRKCRSVDCLGLERGPARYWSWGNKVSKAHPKRRQHLLSQARSGPSCELRRSQLLNRHVWIRKRGLCRGITYLSAAMRDLMEPCSAMLHGRRAYKSRGYGDGGLRRAWRVESRSKEGEEE